MEGGVHVVRHVPDVANHRAHLRQHLFLEIFLGEKYEDISFLIKISFSLLGQHLQISQCFIH